MCSSNSGAGRGRTLGQWAGGGGAQRAHPSRLLRDLAFGVQGVGILGLQGYLGVGIMGLQGYLAHKKHAPPQDHRRSLGIVLV